MRRWQVGALIALVVLAAGLGWKVLVGRPQGGNAGVPVVAPVVEPPASTTGRKIKAQLFFVADDGMGLTGVEREIPYAEQPIDQAREILNAQIAPAAEPLVSAVPAGTTVRALFLTAQGEAFVDLSAEIAGAHPGGSLSELLTIYTIVNVLTFNLPAITAVQLLVDGKEVDTLAGHVDLRRPLSKNVELTTRN